MIVEILDRAALDVLLRNVVDVLDRTRHGEMEVVTAYHPVAGKSVFVSEGEDVVATSERGRLAHASRGQVGA